MIRAASEETQYVLSLSHGKDSTAAIYVTIEVLGWPLDRIVTADVWATDTIPAVLPPMVKFKAKADVYIKERWGIEVEHLFAKDKNGEKLTYEKLFYHIPQRKPPKNAGGGVTAYNRDKSTDGPMCGCPGATGTSKFRPCNRPEIYGFPMVKGGWCKRLKVNVFHQGLPDAPRKLVHERPQTPSFPMAPLHKGRRKILCNT